LTLDATTVTIAAIGALFLAKLVFTRRAPAKVIQEKLQAGATIVDVRTQAEFSARAYPGAINVPLDQLKARLARIPKGKPVVVYCASGARSAMAARILKSAGYEDVSNAGGLGQMP
jgi:phage shock protein E